MKTLRGAGGAPQQLTGGSLSSTSTPSLSLLSSSSSTSSAPGSPATDRHNKEKAERVKNSAADLLKLSMGTGATAWKTEYASLYKTSLEDFEPGPDGVPALIVSLTEAVLSCGGESTVGLFRLQPSSEALSACEERLDSGARVRVTVDHIFSGPLLTCALAPGHGCVSVHFRPQHSRYDPQARADGTGSAAHRQVHCRHGSCSVSCFSGVFQCSNCR